MLTELEMRANDEARHAHRELMEQLQPTDGRPCSTDEFLVALLDSCEDPYELINALEAWVEGVWDEAMEGIITEMEDPAEVAQIIEEAKEKK